jgi:hypothetical protein
MDIFNTQDWTEEAIQFILDNNLEESSNLEFKAAGALDKSDSKKEEIAKDVSAFANSDGGILLYGIIEKNHKADSVDFIDGNLFNKEWLELIITTNISRRIDGIKIFPVRFNNEISKTVYVIKIPISFSAPHMVNKKKQYYKRFNFMAVQMEEYEVRQVYQRKESVKLDFGNSSYMMLNSKTIVADRFINLNIKVSIKNTGNNLAKEYKVVAIFPEHMKVRVETHAINEYNSAIGDSGTYEFSNTKSVIVYPSESVCVLDFNIKMEFENVHNEGSVIELKLYYNNELVLGRLDLTKSFNLMIPKEFVAKK